MDPAMYVIVLASVLLLILTMALALARAIRKKREEYAEKGLPKSGKRMKEEIESSISTSKTLLKILKERGVNVAKAESLVDQAEIAMAGGMYSRAEELLKEAKAEALKANKEHQEGTDILKAPTPSENEEEESPKEVFKKFPPYYLQAKFEMGRADDAIEKAKEEGRKTDDAVELLRIARVNFESENYEKAFSMAIKARKSAEGEVVEYIKLEELEVEGHRKTSGEAESEISEDAGIGESAAIEEKSGVDGADVAEIRKEQYTKRERCPNCGSPLLEGDRFCRKCGYEILRCPNCGAMVFEDDVFCGKCGYRLVEEVFICPECGKEIPEDAVICPHCGARFE